MVNSLLVKLFPFSLFLLFRIVHPVLVRGQEQKEPDGIVVIRTLGRLTLGTTTTLTALGASLGAAEGSPPGWYWYLPAPEPDSQGMEFLVWGTAVSSVEAVGLRP